MPDPAGTTRTPYAAGWDDETCFPDEIRDGAIDCALEDYLAHPDCWPEMWPHELELTVYRDCLWCVGSQDYETCYCEGGHEGWMLLGWAEKETIAVTVEDPDA